MYNKIFDERTDSTGIKVHCRHRQHGTFCILLLLFVIIRAFYCLRSSVSLFSCWNAFSSSLILPLLPYFHYYISIFSVSYCKILTFPCNFISKSCLQTIFHRHIYTLKCIARCRLRCFIIITKENAYNQHWSEYFIHIEYDWCAQCSKNHMNYVEIVFMISFEKNHYFIYLQNLANFNFFGLCEKMLY